MARLRGGMQQDIQDPSGAGGGGSDPLQDAAAPPDPGRTGNISPNDKGQSSESPRERGNAPPPPMPPIGAAPAGGPNTVTAPTRPDVPTPMAGAPTTAPQGVTPFQPLQGPNPASTATPQLRGLYGGGTSGLTGGGLGVPFNAAAADPITALIQQLLQSQK